MIDVYKKYDFIYDEKVFMENFKKEIINKGYNTLSKFHELLKSIGLHSYDTARSYYNLRRIIPLDVLAELCIKLDLDADKIMFPNSIIEIKYNKTLASGIEDFRVTFDAFNDTFYLNNEAIYPDVIKNSPLSTEERYKHFKNAINRLTLIILKFNYMLQKYNFAGLSNDVLKDIKLFALNFIYDKETNTKLNWDEFVLWKNTLKTEDFLTSFYNKYTFILRDDKCINLFTLMLDYLPLEISEMINNLFPNNERVIIG